MQQAPVRLSQTIWSAFRSARPVHRPAGLQHFAQSKSRPLPPCGRFQRPIQAQVRFYADSKVETEKKIEDFKNRIGDSIEARADVVTEDTTLKRPPDETIVHTNPEASSIVYSSASDRTSAQPEPLQTSQRSPPQSSWEQRFRFYMDNMQSQIFVASQRLNDLTGYSSIESLKKEIEHQENLVQESRRAVKENRHKYAEAITTRSQTQREVNDLLHRKHAWSPQDLERFTSLYRSDHANEQAETAAQRAVSDAEARYEEASTKLARTILARYHEEQIWSDKIRQMSTWGTWGLMGLNVLLFVVFQIAIEPWRRRRLVKGFEEKVEIALKERDSAIFNVADRPQLGTPKEEASSAVADKIAEQLVDAVTGTTATEEIIDTPATTTSTTQEVPDQLIIESSAEQVVADELAKEEIGTPDVVPEEEIAVPPAPFGTLFTTPFGTPIGDFAYYEDAFRELFSDKEVVTTQKDLTFLALQGFAGGAALISLVLALLKPR